MDELLEFIELLVQDHKTDSNDKSKTWFKMLTFKYISDFSVFEYKLTRQCCDMLSSSSIQEDSIPEVLLLLGSFGTKITDRPVKRILTGNEKYKSQMKHFLGEIFKDESDVMVPIFKKSRGHRTDWVQKFRKVFVNESLSGVGDAKPVTNIRKQILTKIRHQQHVCHSSIRSLCTVVLEFEWELRIIGLTTG